MSQTKIRLSPTGGQLLQPRRYKVLYGGRGGCKSHDVAGALIALGSQKKMLILCAREIQNSIKQSVHRLLTNKINDAGLNDFYKVYNDRIEGINGTEFHFIGLKHNPDEIKSYEGADICWVEEANNVSNKSWEVLIPTIRKEGSEIWITFNPRYASDPTYERFVTHADENCFVKKVSWRDNPWFPDTLNQERLKMEKTDPAAYKHIWEGEFDERFSGAVYASLISKAREDNRISVVPYKAGVPVITAWDLGRSDSTSIWFAQKIGLEVRIIDFYENNMKPLSHYAEEIRKKPYEYATHYLPHDGRHERLGMEGSIVNQLEDMGLNVEVLPQAGFQAGVELSRNLLLSAWIDEQHCKEGLHALLHYEYEYDESRGRFKDKPRHDWSSHASDAFRYLAMALEGLKPEEKSASNYIEYHYGNDAWMG